MNPPGNAPEKILAAAQEQQRLGRLPEAEALCRQVLVQTPQHASALNLLGVLHCQQGRAEAGIELIRRAIALSPNDAAMHTNLGNALASLGRNDEAIAAFQRALTLRPDLPDAWNNLGNVLQQHGDAQKAIAAHRRAIELRPDFAQAYYNLAGALKRAGDPDAAIASYDDAIRLRPDYAEAEVNRANLLKDSGRLDEAIDGYRRALRAKPNAVTASNLLMSLSSDPGYSAQAIREELRSFNEIFARPLKGSVLPHDNDRDTDRRLRIGYVSPDFSIHPVGRFVLPVLAHHDRSQFEVFCYSEVRIPDPMTLRLKSCANTWRDAWLYSDEQLARQIREDRIDILVDLALHSAANRLLVFARKPAPVQVTWLGYPGSSGLETIDYRLSDNFLDPVELNDAFYSEKTIRLPDCYWCYDPLVEATEINELPALRNGWITFGCLNNFNKITPPTWELWGEVLTRVTNSRLLVLAPPGKARESLLDRLTKNGVARLRVEFTDRLPREQYMTQYRRIDISLDTYPYNGHTTSFDSLWMGVPLVSFFGQTAVSRAGLSILSNLGLGQFATDDRHKCVEIARDLAGDVSQLASVRATLRQRMEQSPLMDQIRFARNIEAAYRQMWGNWCT